MKKMLRFIMTTLIVLASFIGPVVFFLATLLAVLFFDPTLLMNPANMDFALSKTHFLKSWSWKKGEINHKWVHWNDRIFSGSFEDLCFNYDKENINVKTCLQRVYWNVELRWSKAEGIKTIINEPLVIDSELTSIALLPSPQKKTQGKTNLLLYWNMLWSKLVPDLDFKFHRIVLQTGNDEHRFDLKIIKNERRLWISALNFNLYGGPDGLEIVGPHRYRVPYDLKTREPLYFEELKLRANVLQSDIALELTAKIASATLSYRTSLLKSYLENWGPIDPVLKELLIKGRGVLEVKKLVSTIKKLMRPPFNVLPAPFNVLEGPLLINLTTQDLGRNDELNVKVITGLNLTGGGEALVLDLNSDVPYSLPKKKMGQITLGLNFKKVLLQLPHLAKNRLPPQLRPDPRIKGINTTAVDKRARAKKKTPSKKISIDLRLQALGDSPLQIKTNLLDEILKLNLDLAIADNTIKEGLIHVLPLKTTLFKRPIFVPSLQMTFNAPLEPEIKGTVEFHLPEYLVTMKLQGPMSKPRTAFSSNPPLPQDDIIAVLLFGRPLSGLSADDKSATKDVGQIISEGVLSLAVLYYLAGSPVESIGYDPDSKVVSAQFGLGKRNSLHVESGKGGGPALGSYGVRHSLGKGWYIDTTVAQKSESSGLSQSGKNFGVLLERIIAY